MFLGNYIISSRFYLEVGGRLWENRWSFWRNSGRIILWEKGIFELGFEV